jgi:hypothetical protein
MEVEITITITINADADDFDKSELRSDILRGFTERTGYDIQQLDIEIE